MSAPDSFRHDVADTVLALPVVAALGMRFDELEEGRAVSRLAWRRELSHRPGTFQANPMAALADFTGVSAALTLFPAGTAAATADYTVKFLAEARGDELVARARVLRSGSLTVSAVDVLVVAGDEELLCATALVSARIFRSSTVA
jgi:uncharacterized protein (TIGR00369 family)